MWKRKAALWSGLVLIFIICFSISDGFDYDDEDQKLETFSRCPWIRNKLKNGRVRIRSRGRIAKFSCRVGYDLVGKRFATCVRQQWNSPIPMCVHKGCRRQDAPKNGRMKELNQGAALSFECNPGYSLAGEATIYCDGSQWNKEPPRCEVASLQPATSCDFEDPDLCGWTHDPTHDFDWKRNQFGTPSGHVGTGPSYDHTYGKGKAGFYMYGEASAPRNENDTSRLFSPVYSRHYSPGCFVFWYHMYGATIGRLRIYFKKESSVFAELRPSWEKHGDQGNQWLRGNVTVPLMNENFQVVIEGIRGHSYVGDTAIDDVSLMHTNCSSLDSSNSTEDVEVATQDSCRGRCHELDNSSSCGCTDACESDNTCCSDYDKLCAEKSETSNGEDEYAQSTTANPETEPVPELTVTDVVGTPLTVIPAKPYTEAEANFTFSTNEAQETTLQPAITANVSRITTVLLPTGVVAQTTNKPTAVKTTEELTTKTTLAPTVPVKNVSVNTETTGSLPVTSRNTANPTTEVPTTVARVSTLVSTVLTTTVKASTAITTPATTPTTTKESPAIIPTSRSTTPEEFIVKSSKVPSSTSIMVPTTVAVLTTKMDLSSSPTTGIPNNTLPSEKNSVPPVVTSSVALSTLTTLPVRTSEIVEPTSLTTKSVISSSKATIYTTVIDTQTTGRDLKAPTTLKIVPATSKSETMSTITTLLPVVPTKTPTSKTVRKSTPTTPRPVVATKTTAKLNPTVAETRTTTRFSAGIVPTVKFITKVRTTTRQTPSLLKTESQPMNEVGGPHASKAKADMPENHHSVIGICVGLIAVAGLVGGAYYYYRRRRNDQSKMREDSEMRYLSDSEVIEYSDATVLDHLVQS